MRDGITPDTIIRSVIQFPIASRLILLPEGCGMMPVFKTILQLSSPTNVDLNRGKCLEVIDLGLGSRIKEL